jgi:hypothetical protein
LAIIAQRNDNAATKVNVNPNGRLVTFPYLGRFRCEATDDPLVSVTVKQKKVVWHRGHYHRNVDTIFGNRAMIRTLKISSIS